MGMVLKEEGYKEQMLSIVLPYNKERETDTYVERTSGEKIHLAMYKADQAKAVVVISHGYTESIQKYQEVIYYFLTNGYHVWMPEHCGHGQSYRLNTDKSLVVIDSYKRYVEDFLFVAHTCRKTYPELPFYLYAHSMGGGIGATVLGVEPKLFDKALLTSPMIRPVTGNIPWTVTRMIVKGMTLLGHENDYVMGQKPWQGEGEFETSCCISRSRFAYYEALRCENEYLQTCACAYSWIREAASINAYLRKEGWKKVEIPVLLMQAEKEELVSKPEQNRYIAKIAGKGKASAKLIVVPESKHEIFNATTEIQETYWKKVLAFLN